MWRTLNRTGNRQEGKKKRNYILSDDKGLTYLKTNYFSAEQILREHLKIDWGAMYYICTFVSIRFTSTIALDNFIFNAENSHLGSSSSGRNHFMRLV